MSALQSRDPNLPRFAEDGSGAQMGFFDHLDELRARLIRVFLLLILMIIAASFFVEPLLEYLIEPCGCQLTTLKPTDSVVVYFRVALMSAGIVVAPYATIELMLFILPGLTANERRYVLTAMPVVAILFLVGVAFAWLILIPTAIPFLQEFMGSVLEAEWTADNYIAFITSLLFWMGVAFEMPIVFFVLARIGLIGPGVLIRNWRLAVVLITIAAALITPTVDPFNMTLVILPLLGLYAFSILMTAIAYKRRLTSEES